MSDKPESKFLSVREVTPTPTTPHWELYDLQKDPKEMNNVINDPEYAETLKTLKAQLKQLRKDVRDTDEAYPEMQEVVRKHW